MEALESQEVGMEDGDGDTATESLPMEGVGAWDWRTAVLHDSPSVGCNVPAGQWNLKDWEGIGRSAIRLCFSVSFLSFLSFIA